MVESKDHSIVSESLVAMSSVSSSCRSSNDNFPYNYSNSLASDGHGSSPAIPQLSSITQGHDGREFICGWGAAFINITCTFPMNKIMFRQVSLQLTFFFACFK